MTSAYNFKNSKANINSSARKGFFSSNKSKKKNKSGAFVLKYFTWKIYLYITIFIISAVSIFLLADYLFYRAAGDVVVLNTPASTVSSKAVFASMYKAGKGVTLENINDVMYSDKFGTGSAKIKDGLVTDDAKRINMEIYELSAKYADVELLKKSYPQEEGNLQQESFYEHYDPLMLLAISVMESGGSINNKYGSTPMVYGNLLSNANVSPSKVIAKNVGWQFYKDNGITLSKPFTGWIGPIQTSIQDMTTNNLVYPDGLSRPSDIYSPNDILQYMSFKYAYNFKSNKQSTSMYQMQSAYELAGFMAGAHNTGPGFITEEMTWTNNGGNENWPWIDNGAYRQFISDICKQSNLAIILDSAEQSYKEFESGAPNSTKTFQLTVENARKLFEKMGLDYSDYLTSRFISRANGSASDNQNRVSQRIFVPIQVIYAYHQLRLLYSSGM